MKTYIIRLRSLLAFGVALLTLTFIWLGLSESQFYQSASQQLGQVKQTQETQDSAEPADAVLLPAVAVQPDSIEASKTDDFFLEYRIERERTRSEQVEILREIVNNENSSEQMRYEAQQKLMYIAEALEKESKVEKALIAKGFSEAVAVMEQRSVMVIVSSDGLRQEEIAQVGDVVVKMTGCKLEDVVIVPKAAK